ncbi:MAG: hypothetical protein P8Q97_15930 [Myxococcota bacterium]|jgi:Na+-transporting methylmalonyl-CoA/oxaloacetate decarboxylase gamma subunit|nr:hypothetical protein [Myxococcota bacterium]
MRGRRGRAGSSEESFDSLLDTMANVVGILVVLVAVMQLAVGDAVDRIVEVGVREPATLPQVEAAERDQEAVAEAIVAARGELQALPPSRKREGTLLEVARPLLEKLESLPGTHDSNSADLETLETRLVREREAVARSRQAVEWQLHHLARLDVLWENRLLENRPKLVRLPDPRPPPRGAEEIVFFCRYGRVVSVNRRQMLEALNVGVEKALGDSRVPTDRDRPWLYNFFTKQRIGWENFYWQIRDRGPRRLFADMAWRDPGYGEEVRELVASGSRLEESFANHDPGKEYVRFWVWPDSFEVYLEARYLAEAAGFDVAWNAVPQGEEVGSNLLGPTRSQALID